MSHVTTKVASTLLIGVAAAAVSTALPSRTASAADSCLTEPKGDSAQGKHWYYHIERGTGRHCWYLRGEDDRPARTEDDKQAASDKAPPDNVDAAAARSFADAHAEIAPKTTATVPDRTNAAAAPSVWPASPTANTPTADNAAARNDASAQAVPGSSVASRWPQGADAAAPSPSPQPEATLMAAETQDNAANATTDTPPPPVASLAPPQRQIGSIQKLAMVAFGALTLAGLTGSAVYRLGRRRRRNDWLRERSAWQDVQNPNRPPWVDEPRLHSAVADLDNRHSVEPESDFSLAMSEAEPGSEHVEKIEEYLARLTQQLHQEMGGTRPHSAA